MNYIVLRPTPDWLSFDPETSRAFCVHHHLPAETVVDFVRLWDARMAMPYREFREAIKQLSVRTVAEVRGAQVISAAEFLDQRAGEDAHEDSLSVFTDDDDWFAPDLFEVLRGSEGHGGPSGDGALWGSIFLGQVVADTPMEKAGGPALAKRRLSDVVYTNNYAVSGRVFRRISRAGVLEHAGAHVALQEGRWSPVRRSAYLSLANKHPACTVLAHYNMRSERFRNDPRGVVAEYADELAQIRPESDIAWIRPRLAEFLRLIQGACLS